MRGLGILLMLAAFAPAAAAQPMAVEKPRYGVVPNFDLYPQNTPRAALETAIKLLEGKRYEYFLAHVLAPDVLQTKIAEHAAQLEPEVEKQLSAKRDEQKRNPERVNTRDRLPAEPKEFAAIVREEAVSRSFKYVVRDLRAQLGEYPENVKAFRKLLAEGEATDAGTTASFAHKDLPGRTVFLKNDGKRWYLEDRQTEEPKPDK